MKLQTADRELFYVTARSLLKIGDASYLREILEEAAKEDRITKRNVQSLLELVEEDISSILEESMRSGKRFLQVIALEELAKRQYEESVKWIKAMILHPQRAEDRRIKSGAHPWQYRRSSVFDPDHVTERRLAVGSEGVLAELQQSPP
ncbi:MAG: hypothetical protein U5K84_06265 [Alkalibacterium sp.]|nr:hypothetical protein [Alkalibacterium sp.]